MELGYNQEWQTQARGSNDSEYQIYLSCADDGNGIDFTTGKPLKTYDEWLNTQRGGIMYRVYYYTFDYSKYYATMAEAQAAGRASGFNEYTITRVK